MQKITIKTPEASDFIQVRTILAVGNFADGKGNSEVRYYSFKSDYFDRLIKTEKGLDYIVAAFRIKSLRVTFDRNGNIVHN